MPNERKTEDLVEQRLRKNGYYRAGMVVEKQKSDAPRIQKLLEHASKRGTAGGRPEFIIQSQDHPNFLIVIECKADARRHASDTLDNYADFAVDGALLYASFLSKEYDVLAIGASGEKAAEFRVSHYLHLQGAAKAVSLDQKTLVSFGDYHQAFLQSDAKFRQDYNALLDYSRQINNTLQAKKITEAERGFLISGILIALENTAFAKSFQSQTTGRQLATSLVETIRAEFDNARLPTARQETLVQAFSFIPHSPALQDRDFFIELIKGVQTNVHSFMRTHKFYDTIGQFYVEFLRYANNDKGLGIVLTPSHIGNLFSELAQIDKNSVVLDNCCGTGGLLIAAMKNMVRDAGASTSIQKRIKTRQIYGIEFQPKVYALAVSNMILHGDGKTNIYRGDCFDEALVRAIRAKKPTVGLLNPPYRNKTVPEDREELEFVLNNLACLQQGGRCVAIVPITCATAPSGRIGELKREIMSKHTLEAVMSMPIELFHNSKTNVVTCVMVLTAHKPHPPGKKTWLGYWREDGFVKSKNRGRTDSNGTWEQIKTHWVNAFHNREIVVGMSTMQELSPKDEWCAEAYLPTDYAAITPDHLASAASSYALAQFLVRRAAVLQEGESDA